MKKRILIAMTSHSEKGSTGEPTGAYLPEIAHPYEVFARAGLDVDFASVRGGRVPLDGASRDDAAVAAFLDEEGLEARLHASTPSERVDASLYDAVFFAGGHGTMWDFRGDSGFERVARDVYEKGGIVSAVCHGPAALVDVRLSDGRPLVEGKEGGGLHERGGAGRGAHRGGAVPPGRCPRRAGREARRGREVGSARPRRRPPRDGTEPRLGARSRGGGRRRARPADLGVGARAEIESARARHRERP
jgi:putative intracellular protease/amidase